MFPTRDRPNVGGVTSIKIFSSGEKMEVDMGEISVNNSKKKPNWVSCHSASKGFYSQGAI